MELLIQQYKSLFLAGRKTRRSMFSTALRIFLSLILISHLLKASLLTSFDDNSILSDGPPRVLEKYPRVISASVGGSVKLTCPLERPQANKFQDPNDFTETIIVWKKNDKVIGLGWERFKVKADLLSIRDAEEADSGNYTCTATNGFGSVVGFYLLCVTVNDASYSDGEGMTGPNAEFCASSNNQNNQKNKVSEPGPDVPKFIENVLVDTIVQEGEPVSLGCQVHSPHPVRVQWFRKLGGDPPQWYRRSDSDFPKFPSRQYQQAHSSNVFNFSSFFHQADSYQPLQGPEFLVQSKTGGSNTYLSRLTVKRADERDSGLYVCFASNSRGFNYQYAFLKVTSTQVSDDSYHPSSTSNLTWVAAFVACTLTLLFVVVVVVLVRRRRREKELQCRTRQQVQNPQPKTHPPQNFQPPVQHHAENFNNRTADYYPQNNFDYKQVDPDDSFFNHSHRQHQPFKFPTNDSHHNQTAHNIHTPHPSFLPSTTSSDKTNSSYQSTQHPEERYHPLKQPLHSNNNNNNNNIIFQQHNRSQHPPPPLWPQNQPVYY